MSANTNILVITKNGNFVQAVSSKGKAVKILRSLLVSDLKMPRAMIAKAEVIEDKSGILIEGTTHYRAKPVKVS